MSGSGGQFGITMPKFGSADDVFTLAQQLITTTKQYADDLLQDRFVAPVINPNFPTLTNAPAINELPPPNLIDVSWVTPAQPAAFNGSLNIDSLLPAQFSGEAPTLTFPNPPTAFNGTAPTPPALDFNFVYPGTEVTLPTLPQLLSLDTVTFDPLVIPSFDVTVPTLQINVPSIIPYKEGPSFTSSLLAQLDDDLLHALDEGAWTGLPGPIETNLFDRERERAYRQQADALAALDRMEDLGYAMPPGAYLDAQIKIQTDTNAMLVGVSRDIATQQAQLTLDNINKCRQMTVELESKLIDYTNEVNQRALESAKYVTEAAISLYNAAVAAYSAQLKGYEVQAEVYDTQIKGIMAQVDVLKAHIEFENTKAEINTALVNQYKTEVDASLAIIQIYSLQIEIIKTQAEIQKIQVEAYAAQIQGYVGEVNAYTAQVEGYKATAETQGIIEQAYKTSVDAYAAEVQAGVAEANALVEEYKGRIEAYTAQLEGYKAALQAMTAQAQSASLYNEAQAKVYEAEASALGTYNTTLTAQWQAVISEQLQVTQIGVAAAEANGKLYVAAEGLAEDAAKVGAQVMAQLGASALGAVHWASTANWSDGYQESYQVSQQTSTIDENLTSS